VGPLQFFTEVADCSPMARKKPHLDSPGQLFYGDNLPVLREKIDDETVDLIYLDPPFNSKATYNVLYESRPGEKSQAQIHAFDDTWHWGPEIEDEYDLLTTSAFPIEVARFLRAMRTVLESSDMMAYLVMMAPRLVEIRRVLKPNGSVYLHCDPTASHYLKLLMDAVFEPQSFVNEIIWKRTSAHNRTVRYGPVHDIILFYAKGEPWYWKEQYVPYDQTYTDSFYRHIEPDTGRRFRLDNVTSNRPGGKYLWQGKPPPGKRYWGYGEETMKRFEAEGRLIYSKNGIPSYKRYLDEMPGQLLQDVWTDIPPIGSHAAERLGYPTQKPIALMERIIKASCPPDGIVLDPFCGCGTTVDAAQATGRRWIGIDVTYIAIDVITTRLEHRYGGEILSTFSTDGIPEDIEGAKALFSRNPFDFETWAVSLVKGQPNEKQVGDKGVDGRISFDAGPDQTGIAVVSVKGGKQVNPSMVQSLVGAMKQANAEIGIFICMNKPTPGMREVADRGGIYRHSATGNKYPKIQIITIAELLAGTKPKMPTVILPYIKAAGAARHLRSVESAAKPDRPTSVPARRRVTA
jgi:DNA modification methylase